MTQRQETSAFEAAAAYDFYRSRQLGREDFSGVMLVLDMDHAAAALCRREAGGAVQQLWQSRAYGNEAYFDLVTRETGAALPDGEVLQEQLNRWRKSLISYLRGRRRIDADLKTELSDGKTITCGQLCDLFDRVMQLPLEQCLKDAREKMEAEQVNEMTIRILMTGALAGFYPAEHVVRSFFTPMPFLPDSRFAQMEEGDDPAAYARKGSELLRQSKALSSDIGLCLLQLDRDGTERETVILLAKKGTALEQLQQPEFSQKLIVSLQEGVTLQTEHGNQTIPLPRELFAGEADRMALVALGTAVEDGTPVLCLRRMEPNAQIYRVPIQNG